MTLVSYAQNGEDIMLWRALKNIKNGFYIDIGANHPTTHSVTKIFYDADWTGINIEPEKELYDLLQDSRVKDKNLNIAISASCQSIEFYVSTIRGWSTTDKNISEKQKEEGLLKEIRKVEAVTLDKVCTINNVKNVHFLKIDVEGAEKDVLESFTFQDVRPWIIVIEATKPNTQIDVSAEWEYILLENKYTYAYFDGLNKYYIAKEHEELLTFFKIPLNIFDNYITLSQRIIEQKTEETELKLNEAELKAKAAEARANEIEVKINKLINSISWKLTKPLRHIHKIVKWFIIGIVSWTTFSTNNRPRRTLHFLLMSFKAFIQRHPLLKSGALYLLKHFPITKEKIKNIYKPKITIETLAPRQKKIFYDLKQSINNPKDSI